MIGQACCYFGQRILFWFRKRIPSSDHFRPAVRVLEMLETLGIFTGYPAFL